MPLTLSLIESKAMLSEDSVGMICLLNDQMNQVKP